MTMLSLALIIPALMLPMVNHPLSMGLLLLIQSMLIAMTSGLLNLTFWYSYILLLIMIGGMLVLFMYMTSVASNEKFKLSPLLSIPPLLLMIIFPLSSLIDQWMSSSKIITSETLHLSFSLLSLNKFLNFPAIMISTIMILYLLITLIVVIKISKFKQGPLRNFN
uniref:NADH-ubiquinone oxidoreductase chain 6 n=2 Tax=Scarabaeoidea TaxID=75546 RepID=S4SUN1_9SCAR|nr:NADH dehydrogenase subunit 6 [Prosopocoilus gracilis]AFQ62185.1 NADH dehydrogenase subunit 6 [Cheironitis sp. MJTNT-2012]AKN01395.1 NADH dehydrogenase subunit 6 [Prosopocoilus gracilis]